MDVSCVNGINLENVDIVSFFLFSCCCWCCVVELVEIWELLTKLRKMIEAFALGTLFAECWTVFPNMVSDWCGNRVPTIEASDRFESFGRRCFVFVSHGFV